MVNPPSDIEDVQSRPSAGDSEAIVSESLDDLAAEGRLIDAAPLTAASAAAEAQTEEMETTVAAELLGALQVARGLALPILSVAVDARRINALGEVWSDQVLQNTAGPLSVIMVRHGWDVGGILGEYAPYLALLVSLGVPVMQTRAILTAPLPKEEPAQPAAVGG